MATANPTWGAPRVHGELKKTGIQHFRTDGVAAHAQEDGKAIADMDDVPSKSRRPNGLGRLLHSSDYTAPRVVRIRRPCP